ncbi:MAG: DnaJ domain-containing protein [Acidobacteriota bacterium]
MNDQLAECYNVLGLNPGASAQELKAAHRDLAKVWHPDRFHHDPRLQQKAQEKLKEINEAYTRLRAGKGKRQTPPASPRERHDHAQSQTVKVGLAQTIRWQSILAPVLIFVVAFLAASRSLLPTSGLNDQSQIPAIEQTANSDNPQLQGAGSRSHHSANELPQVKDAIATKARREEVAGEAASHPNVAPLPLPTVAVVIDPTTGMIARPNCPMKTRMTYPSGNEPHQYCTSHPALPTVPAELPKPTESRFKSAARRLVSPAKWFDGKGKSDTGNKQDSKSP